MKRTIKFYNIIRKYYNQYFNKKYTKWVANLFSMVSGSYYLVALIHYWTCCSLIFTNFNQNFQSQSVIFSIFSEYCAPGPPGKVYYAFNKLCGSGHLCNLCVTSSPPIGLRKILNLTGSLVIQSIKVRYYSRVQ